MAMISSIRRRLGSERTIQSVVVLLGAVAIVLIVLGLVGFRAGGRVRFSASVEGQVISSRVTEYTDTQGVRHYRPMVIFSYPVDADRYMSNRIGPQAYESARRSDAERIAGRYLVGSTVTVFYDPLDPQRAVLEPGSNPWLFIALGGACVMTTVVLRQYLARKKAHARTTRGR
jgi:hypothetical protein